MQYINPALAEAFGLDRNTGAIINQVLEESPAAKAGLKTGDIVLSIDGRPVKSAADLRNRIGLLPVGKQITFKLLRDGKEIERTITVEENTLAGSGPVATNELLEGVTVGNIEKDSPYYGKLEGSQVLDVERGSYAWRSGLRKGDLITSVNKVPVKNLKEFLKQVDKKTGSLLLRVVRGNTAAFLVIRK